VHRQWWPVTADISSSLLVRKREKSVSISDKQEINPIMNSQFQGFCDETGQTFGHECLGTAQNITVRKDKSKPVFFTRGVVRLDINLLSTFLI